MNNILWMEIEVANNQMPHFPESPITSIEKDSPEYHSLVEVFWGARERVDSILDRLRLDSSGLFLVRWKKRQWGKLEVGKIQKRYQELPLPLLS